MIRLGVEEYCHQCLDFCPEVIKPERVISCDDSTHYTDTIVHCKYRKRCSAITRFLEQQVKGAEGK